MDSGPKQATQVLRPPSQSKENPVQRLSSAIAGRHDAFAQVATRYLPAERLVKLAQVVLAKNPTLADCSTLSVLDSLMTCARLGLEPNEPGGVWLVPFKSVCTPIIDYRGMIDVCRRSNEIMAVHGDVRCKNDKWEYAIDTTGAQLVVLRHTPAEGDRGEILGAYFVTRLRSGESQAVYLSKMQIDDFRARSKADQKGFSPWKTDYAAMAIKTACRRGVNLLPRNEHVQVLRQELQAEDERDLLPMIGDITEGNQEAIDRLLADIGETDKTTADSIHAAFETLQYGPARRLQVLMKYQGEGEELLAVLNKELGDKAKPAKASTAATEATQEQAKSEPAKSEQAKPKTPAEPQEQADSSTPEKKEPVKKKRGRPRKQPAAEQSATKEPAAERPAEQQPAEESAKPKTDPSKFGGSF